MKNFHNRGIILFLGGKTDAFHCHPYKVRTAYPNVREKNTLYPVNEQNIQDYLI